jgi:hypothetical protein
MAFGPVALGTRPEPRLPAVANGGALEEKIFDSLDQTIDGNLHGAI